MNDWWWVGVFFFFITSFFAFKAYRNRAHQLGVEAAKLGWVATGSVKDARRNRNVVLEKGEFKAIIMFEEQVVRLVSPNCTQSFQSFADIERMLLDFHTTSKNQLNDILETVDKNEDFHEYMDEACRNIIDYLLSHQPEINDAVSTKIKAELIAYAATFLAMKQSEDELSIFAWNTFKHSVELRMLSIKDDGSKRNSVKHDEDGTIAFAQHVSSYYRLLDTIDFAGKRIPNNASKSAVVARVFKELGEINQNIDEFSEFFDLVIDYADDVVYPKLKKII